MSFKIVDLLKSSGVGVMPTDTIYGIVGSALSKKVVLKVYKLRKRSPQKPFIILISSLRDLALFGIKLDKAARDFLRKIWPNAVSVILPCALKRFSYLHRGTKSLAFRIPRDKNLIKLLKKTGPLIAPSANPEGKEPAQNISEARDYFGNRVDFYVDGGEISGPASTLIEIKNGKINILRQGLVKIK